MLYRQYIRFLLLSLLLSLSVHAQEQGSSSSTIKGRVTLAGNPLVGISVALAKHNLYTESPIQTVTDEDGRFLFNNVSAGQYCLSPYSPQYSLKASSSFECVNGLIVRIDETSSIEEIDLQLSRGAVITGQITDSNDQPVIEERVRVLNITNDAQLASVESSILSFYTDDRGIFRIYGLQSGKYIIAIGSNNRNPFEASRYKETFYPGVVELNLAKKIEVAEGEEVKGLNFTVAENDEKSFFISGRFIDNSNKPVPDLNFGHSPVLENGNSFFTIDSQSNQDGEFRIEDLLPGKYKLNVLPPTGRNIHAEPFQFEIADKNLTGIEIKLQDGSSITGNIVVEGTTEEAILARVKSFDFYCFVSPASRESSMAGTGFGYPVKVDESGNFSVIGLASGRARFSLNSYNNEAAKNFSILRVEKDSVVVDNKKVELQAGQEVSGVTLVLLYSRAGIKGTVKAENGTVPPEVSFFVIAKNLSDSTEVFTQVDSRGHFLFEGLIPGEYELSLELSVVSEEIVPGTKTKVTVNSNSMETVNLVFKLNKKDGGKQ
ncbi:MAG: carboxypeptidase regulatory-like domain-containing protein [Blastocatellia bacterium]|nr:carboxypeptidase regulatory-like domain-containing protein [Blastocatellia bacterium]